MTALINYICFSIIGKNYQHSTNSKLLTFSGKKIQCASDIKLVTEEICA